VEYLAVFRLSAPQATVKGPRMSARYATGRKCIMINCISPIYARSSSSTNALIVRPTTNSYRRRTCVSGFSCQSFEQTSRLCRILDNALVYWDMLLNDLQYKHKKLTAMLLLCGHARLHRRATKSTKTWTSSQHAFLSFISLF